MSQVEEGKNEVEVVQVGPDTATSTDTPTLKLKVRIKRYHGVCKWTWNVNGGEEDEVCGICQSAFEGTAPGVPYPGDECPVVFGKCSHAFHLICLQKWISGSRNNCPICRREWEFGENKASTSSTSDETE